MNVRQRIGVEQHEIGHLARRDGAQRIRGVEEVRRAERGRAECFKGCEPDVADERLELTVKTEAGNAVNISVVPICVCAGKNSVAPAVQRDR